jgi:hypothetical protein
MTVPQTGQRTVVIPCSNDGGPNRAAVETIQARTMTNTLRKAEIPATQSPADARNAPNGGFKRLALPAVAAAVQTLASAKGRVVPSQDRPANGRRDGKPS